jgi:tartrate dehydrogenase/decarboxylase/D-malate dehydrogenase
MARTHKIAVIPGDGIGKETTPEGLRVLDAAARRFGFDLQLSHYDWSCETYKQTGRMMPEDGLDRLRDSDSIFLGAVGWPGVPDHVSLWGLLIPIRRVFDQYVSLRPCRLMPGARTPLANRTPAEIDFFVVRENTEGEYSSVGGRMFEGTDREFVSQQSVLTRTGTDRILRYAFDLAMTRPRRKVTSATKSNGITFTMPYWDERFAAMAKNYPEVTDRPVPHRHPLRPLRAAPGLVRRGGGLQPVRRHPVGPRPGGGGLHRHRALRQHQPGQDRALHVRAGPRQRARHRRQAHLQPRSARSGPAR